MSASAAAAAAPAGRSSAGVSAQTEDERRLFEPRPYKALQRAPTPPLGSGAREFYTSLWQEKGVKSTMALLWMVEHGCLSEKEIARVTADYQRLSSKKK